MATELGYTVLPVSEVKRQYRAIFDALEAGETVYIAKRGKVVAAFEPFTAVPDSVIALHRSPILTDLPIITARQLGHGSVSDAVVDAEAGLPRLLEREGHVYGMLTAAEAPAPESIPDPDVVGARSEALLAFQENNPGASIDEIMAFSDSLEQSDETTSPSLASPPAGVTERHEAVQVDIAKWSALGSPVEDIVVGLFSYLQNALAHVQVDPAEHAHKLQTFISGNSELEHFVRISGNPSVRWVLSEGERLEAAGDWVDARTIYVQVLVASTATLPDAGVLWRLGNLDRRMGFIAEGAQWFRLALTVDRIADNFEELPQIRLGGHPHPITRERHHSQ